MEIKRLYLTLEFGQQQSMHIQHVPIVHLILSFQPQPNALHQVLLTVV